MQQSVDVTGLSPESIRVVEDVVESLRPQKTDIPKPYEGNIPPSQWPYEEWLKWFTAWVESHPKRDIVIDDDRGSIYDRSCE